MRVLKWIVDRVKGKVDARETPVGLIPKFEDLELSGLNISSKQLEKLFAIERDEWQAELADIRKFFDQFGERLPGELWDEFRALTKRLKVDV
jgi:phosphoenolpyruvate carboxykinase (GTP)